MNSMIIGVVIAAVCILAVIVILFIVLQNSMNNNIRNIGDNQDRRMREFSESLAEMNRSMGEIRNLTSGVDDLKKLMSNVKTRGIIGELQLGGILEEMMSPWQYEENVAVKGGSERVEYAVKIPTEEDSFIYLPIDSKFPGDAYLNLLDAYDRGDRQEVKSAQDALKNAIIKAARDIRMKYIYPPLTTDYGIMFLPFEGLYAEVLRLNLTDLLQREYHVNIAGPTTMSAMLNSLQLGFRSMAMQKRSTEVWDTLENVKTEFEKFNEALVRTQTKMDQTQKELENLIGVRTRSIQRALRNVGEINDEEIIE
ncbi:MAG: DNA recombination protein RmuC [Firmicutes bacterium]|nr:DNA recombination protein RmuC [Bacillota bacterium]